MVPSRDPRKPERFRQNRSGTCGGTGGQEVSGPLWLRVELSDGEGWDGREAQVGRSGHPPETSLGTSDRVCGGYERRPGVKVMRGFGLSKSKNGRAVHCTWEEDCGMGGRGGETGVLFDAPVRHLNGGVDGGVGYASLQFVKSSNRKSLTGADLRG